MPRKMFMAIAVATFLAMMLSLVPGATLYRKDIETFQASRPIQLNEKNGIDLFTTISTHYNIKRVKWQQPAVYVDLSVMPGERVELSHVYQDFYSWSSDMFTYTENVGQVYFRLLEENATTRTSRLLVAIQSDRATMAESTLSKDAEGDISTYVKSTFPVRIDPYFYERITP
ncbi:hypothetical protein ACAF76_012025 [Brevibacillus sp. TJ4]|uniref:hypothetical protein n=1 Tax=Brevibacillus sp. TJ4 TaxID=3234853 RepID=UPI0037D267D2